MRREHLTEYADLVYTDKNDTPYISFPILEQFDFVKHGFSTRLGGISEGIFESMNLGFNRGDSYETVYENYRRICEAMGIKESNLVFTDQVHKAKVRVATKENIGMGIVKERSYSEIDGHITKEANVPLLVFSADCVPILFVDPKTKSVGATHSGWKGTVRKIGAVTAQKMALEFGSDPSDIVAVIGPCIGLECYEVSSDVAEAFAENFTKEQCAQFLKCDGINQEGKMKYHLDLWEANRLILIEAGLKPENVVVSGLCTMCHSELFFSHRATKGQRGSMAGFIQVI
ncbi:MAG: peptidoglycan editing factor PgeF [Clostridiales bacterium]|nr:peptidoglycan editing factor PgeF [Clostridiales bacterium]